MYIEVSSKLLRAQKMLAIFSFYCKQLFYPIPERIQVEINRFRDIDTDRYR